MPNFVRPVVSAALILAIASCNDATAPNTVVEAQNLWQSKNISMYSYVATHACFCLIPDGPVWVEVIQGGVSRVTLIPSGVQVSTSGWYTIDELFDQLLSATAQPATVVFDPILGYPTRVERCCLANDSGSIYTASALRQMAVALERLPSNGRWDPMR